MSETIFLSDFTYFTVKHWITSTHFLRKPKGTHKKN